MLVAILFDLVTHDGRNAVEVRVAQSIGSGYYAGSRQTVYSCAYSDPLGRAVAINMARDLCDTKGYSVVHYGDAENSRRAAWQ